MLYRFELSHNAKKWVFVLFSFIILVISTSCFFVMDRVEDRTFITINEQKIYVFEQEDKKYAFLPSFVQEKDISQIERQIDEDVVVLQSENIPAMFINTESYSTHFIFENSENKEPGELTVIGTDGNILYKNRIKSIKGRGNLTFNETDKKSLAITLFEETELLGNAKGKKYALLSNNFDATLIRNDIAEKIAINLALTQNKGTFVDLYLNGEYYGNYYFTANIEVANEKIDITRLEDLIDKITGSNYEDYEIYQNEYVKALSFDLPPEVDITGGYVVEREYRDRWEREEDRNPATFTTKNNENFVVKYPQYCSDEQIEYITDYINKAEMAILSEDGINPYTNQHYTHYIDENSFVKKYLLEEVCKNYDGGVTSSFFYKDSDSIDSRIKAGPIWDYDMTWGNYRHREMKVVGESPLGVTKLSLNSNSSPWFRSLYEKDSFYNKVCFLYREKISDYLNDLASYEIEQYKNYIGASWDMNYIRWKDELDSNDCFKDKESSFDELAEYISERKKFLDSVWIDNTQYYIVEFRKNNRKVEIRYIEEGFSIGELPKECEEWECDTLGVVDSNTKVYSDMIIVGSIAE